MGKKGKWFGAVKRVFSPESKEKKSQRSKKSKKSWFGKCRNFDDNISEVHDVAPNKSTPQPVPEGTNAENDRSNHAYSVALASAVAAEAAAVAAQAAAEVVRLTQSSRFSDKSVEGAADKSVEGAAAIKIQTAFRGYLARRALRALRGLVRLKTLTNSSSVKHQTKATLRCMQTLARVQSQIRSRRIRMTEENQALQKQLQLKHERELEKQRISEQWDTSLQSKEQIEASVQNKQEASIRRERAMAYAFSHQLRNSSRANPMFTDPNNPQWGWSSMERWMAARPWEKDQNSDRASVRSSSRSATGTEIAKAYARRDTNLERPSSAHKVRRHSLSTPPSKTPSVISMQSSVRDDASLVSTPPVPSYMTSTESAKAKSRFRTSSTGQSDNGSDQGSVSSARKRLSFPVSSAPATVGPRRHSGPPSNGA